MKFSNDVQGVIDTALEQLFLRVPKETICAVYVKGSQVHGIKNAESDVDLVAILKDETHLKDVYDISNTFGKTTNPYFSISAYVLSELQTGKLVPDRPPIPGISRFVKHLDSLALVHGSRPSEPLFRRTDQKDLEVNVRNFFNLYLPGYEEGKFGFMDVIKQTLWLAEAEARVAGVKVAHSWKDAVAALPSTHIAHEALSIRVAGGPTPEKQTEFIEKLRVHLKTLESSTS